LSPLPARRRKAQRKPRDTPHHVALLFNANKVYDREIISGIGAYLRSTRAEWDRFIEDDFRARLTSLAQWHGDGIIADYDDPAVSEALAGAKLPVVAAGGPTRTTPTTRRACPMLLPTTSNLSNWPMTIWSRWGSMVFYQETAPYFVAMAKALHQRLPASEYQRFLGVERPIRPGQRMTDTSNQSSPAK
jgi:LacI family transcriptional regulator